MPTPNNMQGKVAIVTGAASGLGRATALKLGAAGANVCIVDLNAGGLEETASQLRQLGVRVLVHATNLAVRENCAQAITTAVAEFGRLDALCNVAGIIVMCNAHDMSDIDYEKTIAINLNAPFYLTRAGIPHLLQVNGAVVNVASSAAFVGEAYAAAYCASKAGLVQMTKALAMEYMHKPIRFNAVAPGGMATNIANSLKMPEGVDYSLIKRYSGLRGLIEVDDAAELVAFLASDAARGYHGACLNIDRGITAG